jgi:hypothetical protein
MAKEDNAPEIEKAINHDEFLIEAKSFFENNRKEVGKVAKSRRKGREC